MGFSRSAAVTAVATITLLTPVTSFAAASPSATTEASAQVVCPMEVVRSSRRYFPTKTGWDWSNFFKKGSTIRVYQGETRKIADGLVVVKTTTVVGGTRFWVDQRDITAAGACAS